VQAGTFGTVLANIQTKIIECSLKLQFAFFDLAVFSKQLAYKKLKVENQIFGL